MKLRKLNGEIPSILLLLVVSLIYFVYSMKYPLGDKIDIGEGFFPRLIGLLMILLSAGILISAIAGKGKRSRYSEKATEEKGVAKHFGRGNFNISMMILLSLAFYILLIDWIGFMASSFLFLNFCVRVFGDTSFLRTNIILGIFLAFIYLLFVFWLNVPLPKGLFL